MNGTCSTSSVLVDDIAQAAPTTNNLIMHNEWLVDQTDIVYGIGM